MRVCPGHPLPRPLHSWSAVFGRGSQPSSLGGHWALEELGEGRGAPGADSGQLNWVNDTAHAFAASGHAAVAEPDPPSSPAVGSGLGSDLMERVCQPDGERKGTFQRFCLFVAHGLGGKGGGTGAFPGVLRHRAVSATVPGSPPFPPAHAEA